MTPPQKKLKFVMGKIDPDSIGLTEKMQIMIRERLPEYFPRIGQSYGVKENRTFVLRFDRNSNESSRWILSANGLKYYVKIYHGRGRSYLVNLIGRGEAISRSYRAKNGLHYFLPVFINLPSHQEVEKYKKGILELPAPQEWAIVEVQALLEPAVTLDYFLRKTLRSRRNERLRKSLMRIARKLARSMQIDLHCLKPSNEDLGLQECEGQKLPDMIQKEYEHSLCDILDRMNVYMPPHRQAHALVTKKKRERLRTSMETILEKWTGKAHRLSIVHGDPNTTNILIRPLAHREHMRFIDFSPRVHVSEPTTDDGRLVGDLLELYFETGDPLVRQFIDAFIDESEKITGDKKYRQGLCFGIFAMTLLKLCTFGRPIQDQRVAKLYLKNSLRILEKGYFCW